MEAPASHADSHAVVVPLYGVIPHTLPSQLAGLSDANFRVVLVDNRTPQHRADRPAATLSSTAELEVNHNRGGLAGGFNRGVAHAIRTGASTITLLDQDSRIEAEQILLLSRALAAYPDKQLVVGPSIWDEQRQARHGRWQASMDGLDATRLLISSGTTFRSSDWPQLGSMHEGLFIDFVDHAWCFRAQKRGFQLFQHPLVTLRQQFGAEHPNRICRRFGMQLYTPVRHYYGLRNLRWLCLQPYIPLDLKLKELLKMLVKPWLWLAFEPRRSENLKAIVAGVFASLPARY